MVFNIGDFRVYTKKESEKLDETYYKPIFHSTSDKRPRGYKKVNKIREFIIFDRLILLEKRDNEYYRVINDIFDFIDLIEMLKGFAGNRLTLKKKYNINDKFTGEVVTKNKKISLALHFKNYSYNLYLDKFECSSLAAKFSKILSRCEVWQKQKEQEEQDQ